MHLLRPTLFAYDPGGILRKLTRQSFTLSAGVILCAALAIPSPAQADGLDRADVVEDTVQSLSDLDGVGPIEDARVFEEDSRGELTFESDAAKVAIEAGVDPSIVLQADGYEPIQINSALPGDASVAEDGTAVFSAEEEAYSVTPLPYDDGSVQIVTVLDDETAPERYIYDISSTSAVNMTVQADGMVTMLDADGAWLGGVAAPWAFDAAGVAVPTHFEVYGTTLVQVVEHRNGGFEYPVTADPYQGQALWIWSSITSENGQPRVNLRLSSWGQQNQVPWILIDHGWPEALNRSNAIRYELTSKATMRQQYDCHAFGSAFAGDWNLEKWRPNRDVTAGWSAGVAVHHCNWSTTAGY